MVVGDKLKELRATKKLSQGDIEKRTGLLRCYISRVENGHTVPTLTLSKKWLVLWKFQCTDSSQTKIESRSRTFLFQRPRKRKARKKTRNFFPSPKRSRE